jgi:hypothetical protein
MEPADLKEEFFPRKMSTGASHLSEDLRFLRILDEGQSCDFQFEVRVLGCV